MNLKRSLGNEAAAAILAATVLTIAARGTEEQVATVIVAENPAARLGDPIKVSVSVTNPLAQEVQIDQSATAFDCFEVVNPDGQRVSYVGSDGQVVVKPVRMPPSSSITIADALDLTDKYIFQKAGQYSIRLKDQGFSLLQFKNQGISLPGSRAITVDVTPGQLSKFDQLAVRLLPVCPKGWRLVKDRRGEVAPFGHARVDGLALHLCHNHMRGEAVYLWFTNSRAVIDVEQKPRVIKAEYLGGAGRLYVYTAVASNTPALWPTAVESVSHALQIPKE